MEVVIGPYRTVRQRQIGAAVPEIELWLGEDIRTGDQVSLTVLPAGMLETVNDENAVADQVVHPHLLTVLDVAVADVAVADVTVADVAVTDVAGNTADRVALVAAWPAGGLLVDLIGRRGPLTVGETLTVLIPLADAVATAHRAGIRHGGICPEDIWFDGVGRPLLGPLSVSRVAAALNQGLPIGSRDVAPEVVRGEAVRGGPITLAADVFSLGSVALVCLTGRSAWPADEPADVLVQSAAGLWPDLPDDAGPPGLISLVRAMLASSPGQRPSAADVLAQLSRVAVPQPVRLTGRTGGIADRPRSSSPRHLSVPPESLSERPDEAGPGHADDSGQVVGAGVAGLRRRATPSTAFSPEATRARQRPASPSHADPAHADPTDRPAPAPVHLPGVFSRITARVRRARRSPGSGPRRGSGLRSGEPGPVDAQAELRELMRRGLPIQIGSGGADEPTAGPGRLGPLARTGLILLVGVLVTLVALQVSVWWDDGSDMAAVEAGSGTAVSDTVMTGASPDWTDVVKDLDTARSRALAAADPALLAAVYDKGAPGLEEDAKTIRQLADQGLRVVDGVHEIVSVSVVGSTPPSQTFGTDEPGAAQGTVASSATHTDVETVRLEIVDTLPAHPIVDAGGQHVGTTQSRPEQRRVLVLVRAEQGFRIVDVEAG